MDVGDPDTRAARPVLLWASITILVLELAYGSFWVGFFWATEFSGGAAHIFGMSGIEFWPDDLPMKGWVLHIAFAALLVTLALLVLRRRAAVFSFFVVLLLHIQLWLRTFFSSTYDGQLGYILIIAHAFIVYALISLIRDKVLR